MAEIDINQYMIKLNVDQVYSKEQFVNMRDQYADCISLGGYYKGAVLNPSANTDFARGKEHADLHLKGIFSYMTDKKDLTFDNITLKDVQDIAQRFTFNSTEKWRKDQITAQNYKAVLCDIAVTASAGLSGIHDAVPVGFMNKDFAPLILDPKNMINSLRKSIPAVDEPKKPNAFKTLIHKIFKGYKHTFEEYDNAVTAYENYQAAVKAQNDDLDIIKDAYEFNNNAVKRHFSSKAKAYASITKNLDAKSVRKDHSNIRTVGTSSAATHGGWGKK